MNGCGALCRHRRPDLRFQAIFLSVDPLQVRFLLTLVNIDVNSCFMEDSPDPLTAESRFFVEGTSSADVSRRFGYTQGSFRVLCHHFRRSKPEFFRELKRGPHTQPKKDAVRELILGMRKQNLS